jgi:hypothetical protein
MPPVILAAALAACSGGGGGAGTTSPQLPSGLPASGTLTITGPQSTASSLARKPLYISSATNHAALFIDAITAAAGSSSACTTGCTIPFSTTSGTHTFNAEIDNGSHVVLAEGTSGPQTVVAGPGNSVTITLNGAAAEFAWVANTAALPSAPAQPTSIVANWAVADSSAVQITNAPTGSATFDGGTITFAVSIASGNLSGSSPTFTPTTLAHPDGNGGDYSFTAACNGAAGTGTFNVTATSGAGSGDVLGAQLTALAPSVTYPSSTLTVTAHTYTCTNGVLSDSTGNATLQ